MEDSRAALQVISQAVSDWWDDWVNMFVISLIWVLSWATIVLGPPVTLGLWYVANQLAHGHSQGLSGFLSGSRRYFFKGWLWALVNLVAGMALSVNFWFYRQIEVTWIGLVQTFVLLLVLAWLVVQFYALPYLMEQEEKSLRLAMRNGLFTALAAPIYTMVIAGVAFLVAGFSVGLVVPLLVGGPALIAVLGNRAVLDRVEAYGVRERETEGS